MRRPETIERLYLDFDGFFASVEQAADKRLRGRPIAVVPFEGTDRTCVIACSREAKMLGVKNVMPVVDARSVCADLILVPQKPDLYRRAHNALLSAIETVIPVDAIKSIDELTCRLDARQRQAPEALARAIKDALAENVGPAISASIGMAANRQLAKMACKAGKWHDGRYGDGLAIWHPEAMPAPLLAVDLPDIPGVGERMARRLYRHGIQSTADLYALEPKHMRKLWHSVTGERLWYALHGYDVQAEPSKRGMFGHGRVLPPESRSIAGAREISRLLLIKAGRRLRREGWRAGCLSLGLDMRGGGWGRDRTLPAISDDHAMLEALDVLWQAMRDDYPNGATIYRVHVTLSDLTPQSERQTDFLDGADSQRRRWETMAVAVDGLNARYARTIVSLGPWAPPSGGHVGGKISYTRIPSAEDFW